PAALSKIADIGYDPEYGARPIRRALQREAEDRLSEALLAGDIQKGERVALDVEENEFIVRRNHVSSAATE
ncbi:hypothetical protein F8N00_04995, partial [Exiguobacterium sp. A1_3_1]